MLKKKILKPIPMPISEAVLFQILEESTRIYHPLYSVSVMFGRAAVQVCFQLYFWIANNA